VPFSVTAITYGIVFNALGKLEALIEKENRLINIYFNSLNEKDPVLYLYNQNHAFAYRLPKLLE